MSSDERIYTANLAAGWGPDVWREMMGEALRSRELVWRLFMRDFSARYRQSVLGVLWALLLPLMAAGTFIFLNRSGLLNVGEISVPYPVYVFLGLAIWQAFASGLTYCSNAIVSGGSMVVKINFPKETLVVAAMGQVIFELLVRVGLVAMVMVLYQVAPKWTVVFFPLTLLPLLMFSLGLGFFLSLVNVLLRDVANTVTLATTFLMFLTPVIYPAPRAGLFGAVMAVNPLTGMLTASRDVVFTGYLTDPLGFVWTSVLAVAFFLFAWRVFHLVEPRMAERV